MEEPDPAYGAHLMAYAGIPTFMHRQASRRLYGVDEAIVGIAFDSGASSFRSGTRFGPRKIREASLAIWGYNRILGVAPLEVMRIVDYGDVAVQPTDIQTTIEAITAEVGALLDRGPKVIALGGDHSITLPLLRAHAARLGQLAVVHFDSHADTMEGRIDHGTPFRHAIEEGLIHRDAYIQIGIRGPLLDSRELAAAESLGARILPIEACFEMGMPSVIRTIQDLMGGRRVYVSLDIDAVDPAYAPGTGTPEIGGFTSYQMLQMVRGLAGLDLVGFDLVEVSPPYDAGEITSILAANLAFEFLSLLAVNRLSSERRPAR
ncbi:MAG: agmatinase [Deltaproteobacteria bacterium]|nr:agmatinase [Deltaproteobacteria bacterium]